jgi:superfamily II DNA or RNA helicase
MLDLLEGPGREVKTLRPHQEQAIADLRSSLARGNRRVVLQMPTGGGKTLTSSRVIKGALAKGNRVIFTAPFVSLIDQTVAAFRQDGIDHIGVMQGQHPGYDPTAPVQVCTVQTLARREAPDGSVVIVDEAHVRNAVVETMMAADPARVFIGLSATPWTQGMGLLWDDLVVAATVESLIRDGYLCPFRAFVGAHPELKGVRVKAGEYVASDLMQRVDDKRLTGDIVATWLERGENRPTLAFAVNCAHARGLHEAFTRAGVASAYVDARTDGAERRLIERRFRSGEVKVACSVRTLTTGVDWPVACIVDAAPTLSKMLHVQKIGRGLRVNPGWDDCIILDHADNSIRHGLVTDIHQDTLCKAKPGEKPEHVPPVAMPTTCGKCSAVKPPKVRECPSCGHVPAVPVRAPEVDPGELTELTGSKLSKPTEADKQRFYSMALWLDRERGKGGKLVAGLYKAKFGVWPRGMRDVAVTPDQPFLNWEKSRRIAYAKRMAKQREMAGGVPA